VTAQLHEHPDSLPIDFSDRADLARVARISGDRWRAGWRVRRCGIGVCKKWVWVRPPSLGGDPTGGR
jgi:hypothetical protein